VVGVAADAKYADLREQTPRMIYFPVLQTPNAGVSALEIRSRSDAAALALGGTIREAVADVDARLRVGSVSTLSERVDRTLGREHMVTRLSGAFGAITLVLVSIGVYGSVAYSAGRRMKELGVRIALGARRGEVIRLVLRELVVVVLAGVAVGLAAGWVLGRLVQSLLFGLSPGDLPSLAATAGILMATSSLAALVPAVRASRLDPARVLRD
jgi:ABC-type antimicrobial peptide transport system permease subunit